ncbi:DUF2283 domain-containing protein [Candidatus Pacearchaeota archaeon]|jgi:uncharacterized protein YuzE|nr:DUF2283 domain-containing protein [Candidatus Pacearchaeota archaeon]|tara:strand:+ start:428 stop:631 length:204 start_codon:yes stop_codon:yes gene_type:complete
MKIRYDKDADAMYLKFGEGDYVESKEIEEGVVIDFDENGKIIGMEVLDVSEKMSEGAFTDMNLGVSF